VILFSLADNTATSLAVRAVALIPSRLD